MKKIIPIISIILIALTSCSSEDARVSSEIHINPPNWIQGKWVLEGSTIGESGWRFTSEDVIMIQSGSELSQRGQLNASLGSGQDVSAQDEYTNNTYKLVSNFPAGQTVILSFTKVSNTEISFDAVTNSIYVKQ